MTPTVLWPVVAAIVVLAIGIAVAVAKARARDRAAAGGREGHPIDRECARRGHVYRFHGTGLRCFKCGNYMARVEGELYGRAEDGRIERRREPREHQTQAHLTAPRPTVPTDWAEVSRSTDNASFVGPR